MASPAPSPFIEDQTDEDFFDKLVEDDAEVSPPKPADMARAFSCLNLAGGSADAAPPADARSDPGCDNRASDAGSPHGSSKGTSVKVVQWSAFSVDSQPFGSYSDFLVENAGAEPESENIIDDTSSYAGSHEQQIGQSDASDSGDAQNWENLYPGWKYDHSTGQWYQVGSPAATDNVQDVSFFQHTGPSVLETIAEDSTASTDVTNWNPVSYGGTEYPHNMVFDPQYPGWYFDTNAQQWYTLDSYNQTLWGAQSTAQNRLGHDVNASTYSTPDQNQSFYGGAEQHRKQDHVGQEVGVGWDASTTNFAHQNMWQPAAVDKGAQTAGFSGQHQVGSLHGSMEHSGTRTGRHMGFKAVEPVSSKNYGSNSGFVPVGSSHQYDHQLKAEHNTQTDASNSYYGNQNSTSYYQKPFQVADTSYSQSSYANNVVRSPDGRPPHALVTFGFGGKLIVMKDFNSLDARSQDMAGSAVSILNLTETVVDKAMASSINNGSCFDYFNALCEQSFPGPLVGGNAATKDVNKWIDERIRDCLSPHMDFQKGEFLRLLLSLLKISSQHYGKLRSPFGSDQSSEETDGPESAVTKLFASARTNSASLRSYGSSTHCLQSLPSEGQIQATAAEVQNLLVSGRRKEALQRAQEGQLWGPALVLAAQLGEKFYVDTVRLMAHHQFVSGSPLRTLCLLIAGQPADVFSSAESSANSLSGAVNAPQPAEIRATGMLDGWEENLAIITANRTKDDELVIIHLGDCLWKERGEITAAHTCYLVAEANFEPYSDSARLCLIGADHWKYPRSFASPEAIQRTEFYEYSKVLGNSQFILQSFQPYKFIYASMLAEVGKVAEALRYCQSSLKLLKNSGRAPEVETWKSVLSSLEERLRTHQQGGYSANLDPAKLVGKLFTSIDRSIHRMIGAPPPSLPPVPKSSMDGRENFSLAPKVSNSQSTMAMSSLVPSPSVGNMSELTGGGRKTRHNRSVSEPDFGSPKQNAHSADMQSKASGSVGPSRFGRIGSQLFQKTMGWVSRSRADRQAKLGEKNKFYYDEKLKRWVEEGADPPAEEAALPPPPTKTPFQNGTPDYNINSALKSQSLSTNAGPETVSSTSSDNHSGFPPIPPGQNQFSARGRMGVRSRYVDTFNKGGGTSMNSFQIPSATSLKPAGGAKLFIPTKPANSNESSTDASEESKHDGANGGSCTYVSTDPSNRQLASPPPPPPPSSIQRFPSVDNLQANTATVSGSGNRPSSHSRRASWSGNYPDSFNSQRPEMNHIGNGSGAPSSFAPNNSSPVHSSSSSSLQLNGGNLGDELHEVEL